MPSTIVKSFPLLTQAFDTRKTFFYIMSMSLTPAESRLHSNLSEYLSLVSSGKAGSAEPATADALRSIFATLEKLESELSPKLDPRLRHFMESKSYRKAYDYLSALLSSKLANSQETRQSCTR